MATLTHAEIDEFLRDPHVAQLATIRPDGRPHVAPVWYIREDEQVKVMTFESSVKVRNVNANPKVALSVATDGHPYRYVVLEGDAVVTKDNLEREVERLCVHYEGPERGAEYTKELLAGSGMVMIDVTVRKTISWKEDE